MAVVKVKARKAKRSLLAKTSAKPVSIKKANLVSHTIKPAASGQRSGFVQTGPKISGLTGKPAVAKALNVRKQSVESANNLSSINVPAVRKKVAAKREAKLPVAGASPKVKMSVTTKAIPKRHMAARTV